MADSLSNLLKQLPVDAKSAHALMARESDIQTLLYMTEQIEIHAASSKIDPQSAAMSLLYQLLCYLILNQMGNAKYFWKRLPKELKADGQAAAIWDIGRAMWRAEYSKAFELMDQFLASQAVDVLKPFVDKLRIEYRRRCLDLVTLSYSSITVKELLGYVSNLQDKGIVGKDKGFGFVTKAIIEEYNLQEQWCLNQETGIIDIQNKREEFDLDSNLMNEFTQYVVFMEAQQNV